MSRARTALWWLAGALVLLIAGTLVLVWVVGPRFGIQLVPPSPSAYAAQAASVLDRGYYARGPAWQQARAVLLAQTSDAPSYEATHAAIEQAAKVAGGRHSFLMTAVEAGERSTPQTQLPSVTPGRVTILRVPALGVTDTAFLERYTRTLTDGVAQSPDACGWIVDLRGNTGGNMWPMVSGLTPLIPDGRMLSFRSVDGTDTNVDVTGGAVVLRGVAVADAGQVAKRSGPIAVLQDDRTASSGEAAATAFLGLPNARSFGAPTAGYTSANEPTRLYDGAVLQLTTSTYVDRTGRDLAEQPIQPDEPTGDAEASALAWLAGQGCR